MLPVFERFVRIGVHVEINTAIDVEQCKAQKVWYHDFAREVADHVESGVVVGESEEFVCIVVGEQVDWVFWVEIGPAIDIVLGHVGWIAIFVCEPDIFWVFYKSLLEKVRRGLLVLFVVSAKVVVGLRRVNIGENKIQIYNKEIE